MSQSKPHGTADGGAAADGEGPAFHYDARLANEIELRWQDR
jgi:hypothetical protein